MILVDANLLLYAHVSSFPQHALAREWLDEKLNGTARVGLPWPSLLGFVRLAANPRVFERPESVPQAWKHASVWLSAPTVWIPQPTAHHSEILARLLSDSSLRASHVPDAHLAALAIEHGLQLCTTDSDFARFSGLHWLNPLASAGRGATGRKRTAG